uniref:MAPK regulated corepressor interacting protein 2 n=1 Tax=Cuerna arida TaxID=1464854 RepID=A0A1B6FPP2_9HEMI
MYTVSKGPSKIVHKTRRGITQNLERLENSREYTKKWVESQCEPSSPDDWTIRIDKPVFHNNGKKSNSTRAQQEVISPQHEEIIKFIYDSWNSVCKECEENGETTQCEEENGEADSQSSSPSIVYYKESEPNHHLQDFKPFDLESWWGKRLFNTITKSIP